MQLQVCMHCNNLCSHESLKTLLTDALSKTDVLVTSGGVSMGEKVRPILKIHRFIFIFI